MLSESETYLNARLAAIVIERGRRRDLASLSAPRGQTSCNPVRQKRPPEGGGPNLEGGLFGLEEDNTTDLEDIETFPIGFEVLAEAIIQDASVGAAGDTGCT